MRSQSSTCTSSGQLMRQTRLAVWPMVDMHPRHARVSCESGQYSRAAVRRSAWGWINAGYWQRLWWLQPQGPSPAWGFRPFGRRPPQWASRGSLSRDRRWWRAQVDKGRRQRRARSKGFPEVLFRHRSARSRAQPLRFAPAIHLPSPFDQVDGCRAQPCKIRIGGLLELSSHGQRAASSCGLFGGVGCRAPSSSHRAIFKRSNARSHRVGVPLQYRPSYTVTFSVESDTVVVKQFGSRPQTLAVFDRFTRKLALWRVYFGKSHQKSSHADRFEQVRFLVYVRCLNQNLVSFTGLRGSGNKLRISA